MKIELLPSARRTQRPLTSLPRTLGGRVRGRIFPWLLALLVPILARADTNLTTLTEAALRAALDHGPVITFSTNGNLHLTESLVISNEIVLRANDGTVTFDTTNGIRFFTILGSGSLTLSNFVLAHGLSSSGGAIQNHGRLWVSDCMFSNNLALGDDGAAGADRSGGKLVGDRGGNGGSGTAGLGGALHNLGAAFVSRCTFITNAAAGGNGGRGGRGGNGQLQGGDGGNGGQGGEALGGAIYNQGLLHVTNSTFQFSYAVGGSAGEGGSNGLGSTFPSYLGRGGAGGRGSGGALCSFGLMVLSGSTFDRNHVFSADSAHAGSGATVGSDGRRGTDSQGGAVSNWGTNFVVNCTFSGNTTTAGSGGTGAASDVQAGDGGDGGDAWGGNYYNGGRAGLTNCTFAAGSLSPGLPGTAGTGLYRGDRGDAGQARGGNLANVGACFLQACILAYPGGGTNTVLVTNVVTVTTNVPTNLVVRTTNTFVVISSECLRTPAAGCATNVVFTNTVPPSAGSNTFGLTNAQCLFAGDIVPQCLTNIIFTNSVRTNLEITRLVTNVFSIPVSSDSLNAFGSFTDAGHNLSTDATPPFSGTSSNRVEPFLGPLRNNGGFTATMALPEDSPAIGWGGTEACLAFDQRGVARMPPCDAGAYEFAPTSAPPRLIYVSSQTTTPGVQLTFSVGSVRGLRYLLESTHALRAGSWTAVATNLGTGADVTLQDRNVADRIRFYRVRVQ